MSHGISMGGRWPGDCAPSLNPEFFWRLPGLKELLSRGYVVVTTDYPGSARRGQIPQYAAVAKRIVSTCCKSAADALLLVGDAKKLKEGFVLHDPATTEPWKGLMRLNTPGACLLAHHFSSHRGPVTKSSIPK